MTDVYVPHDPPKTDGVYGDTCALCGVAWPCDERRKQRREKLAIDRLLDSALYKPTTRPEGGILWESPLGWKCWLSYGEKGLRIVVDDMKGGWVGTEDGTVEWLSYELP